MRRTLRITAVCVGLATACGGGGGGGDEGRAAFQAALQGSWNGCVPLGANSSTAVTFVISDLNFSVTPVGYGTPDCTGQGQQLPVQSGTIKIGSPVTAQLNAQSVTAYQVDQTITSPANAAGTTYTLAYVDAASAPNRLYMGDTSGANDGSTAAKRPTTLAPFYFEKE